MGKLYKEEELIEIIKDKYEQAKETNPAIYDAQDDNKYYHAIGVKNACLKINEFFNLGLDQDKLINMGMLHDYAKFYTFEEYKALVDKYPTELNKKYLGYNDAIKHSLFGDIAVIDDLGINDQDILTAIKYHSTGHKDMSIYDEVLMIADFIDEYREGDIFNNARKILYESNDAVNIKKCLCYIISMKIKYVKSRGNQIYDETYYAFQAYKSYLDNPLDRCKQILRAIDHNLIKDVKVYDVTSRSPLYDYVIVGTAVSAKSKDAVISYLRSEFDLRNVEEGETWTLVDLNDCLVHVFSEEARTAYALDRILGDARTIDIK